MSSNGRMPSRESADPTTEARIREEIRKRLSEENLKREKERQLERARAKKEREDLIKFARTGRPPTSFTERYK